MSQRGSQIIDPMERLRRLQLVTDATLAHLSVDDLLDELLLRVRDILDADTAAVLLLDPSTDELVARAAKGIEEEVEQGVRIPVGKGFAGRIAAERRPVTLDRVDHSTVLNPILFQKGIRSLLGVPLLANSEVVGVMHVGTTTPHTFSQDEIDLMQLVADRVALALQVRLSDRGRVVLDAFQRTFLPDVLPSLPGIRIATRYLPAASTVGVGGDWYDTFALPSGELIFVIGDVAGHGLAAASLMGKMGTPCVRTPSSAALPRRSSLERTSSTDTSVRANSSRCSSAFSLGTSRPSGSSRPVTCHRSSSLRRAPRSRLRCARTRRSA